MHAGSVDPPPGIEQDSTLLYKTIVGLSTPELVRAGSLRQATGHPAQDLNRDALS